MLGRTGAKAWARGCGQNAVTKNLADVGPEIKDWRVISELWGQRSGVVDQGPGIGINGGGWQGGGQETWEMELSGALKSRVVGPALALAAVVLIPEA